MTEVEHQPPAVAEDDKIDKSVWFVAIAVVLGVIMSILDITVVNIALPTLQGQWGIATTSAAWTMTGYTLALATVIPITGWASDRFGTKRLYLSALVLFIAGSLLCATAQNIGELIGFRIIQGLGGGMLMPLGMTIMTRAAGAARLGQVMAVLGVPLLLGPICGPILGGWLIQIASWHWIFLINLPIGVVALVYSFVVLPKDNGQLGENFDFLGMLLLSPGLALFLYGVTDIPQTGTVAAREVLIPSLVGLALIAAFVVHSLRSRHPLIDLRLFANHHLASASVALTLFACSFFGAAILFPMYFQQIRGQGTLDTGLLMIPNGLGAMLTMPIAGRVADKTGPGKIVMLGIGIIVVGMATFIGLGSNTSYTILLAGMFVMGLGQGCAMMPIMTAALTTLTDQQVARGSTLMNIINQAGSAAGTAITSVVLTNNLKSAPFAMQIIEWQMAPDAIKAKLPPNMRPPAAVLHTGLSNAAHAFGHTFVVSICVIVVCVIPVWFLPRTKMPTSTGSSQPVVG